MYTWVAELWQLGRLVIHTIWFVLSYGACWKMSSGYRRYRVRYECPALVVYTLRITQNLKRAGAGYGVPFAFTSFNKWIKLIKLISSFNTSNDIKCPMDTCSKGHDSPFVPCRNKIVHRIPLPCWRMYVGQTGRYRRGWSSPSERL